MGELYMYTCFRHFILERNVFFFRARASGGVHGETISVKQNNSYFHTCHILHMHSALVVGEEF